MSISSGFLDISGISPPSHVFFIKLRFCPRVRQAVERVEQRIYAVVILFEDQPVLVTGILTPLRYQVAAPDPLGCRKNFEAVAPDALVNLINHGFFRMVGLAGLYQVKEA